MYRNKFSVSGNKSAVHNNYTFDFRDKVIQSFKDFKDLGFTMLIFSGNHRKSEYLIGMSNLGYIDIDADFEPIFNDGLIDFCRENHFGLARSGSNKKGKYRIIFKRSITIEIDNNETLIKWISGGSDGFVLEQFRTGPESIAGAARYVLETELEYFKELLEGYGNTLNIDITSANPAMHSKELGEVLLDFEVDKLGIIPLTLYNFEDIGKTFVSNAEVSFATQNGIWGHFQVTVKDSKEIIRLVRGNCLRARVGNNIEPVGIADCIKRGVHLMDPIEQAGLNSDLRCEDDDAYMPFIVSVKKDVMFVTSGGQHNRNYGGKSIILIVFYEAEQDQLDTKYVSSITVDGFEYTIDEKNKKFARAATPNPTSTSQGKV